MAESFGDEFTIVEVTADDLRPTTQLWVAAAKPNQAITLVFSELPEGWTAEAMIGKPSEALLKHFADLGLKPGGVRKLTE